MITLRRAEERLHNHRRTHESWHTFHAEGGEEPLADCFGALEALNEYRLPPGAGIPRHSHHGVEIVTYVRTGALAHDDSQGRSGVIQAGEFQRTTTGRGVRYTESNASMSDPAHAFQMWLRASDPALQPHQEQKRFFAAERRDALCVVASPDGRSGSLRIHADALVCAALLHPGQHVVHELLQRRSAWLHIVVGEATLGDVVLTTGDGVGIGEERAVSLTAREETEILLLDLGEQQRRFLRNERSSDRSEYRGSASSPP